MFTYVINTSENKTFDSDILLELAGYNKIHWKSCRLNEVSTVAKEIIEKQNALGADEFRIAMIVDFYGFDRVRVPYGHINYGVEEGVDISLYFAYIDVFLTDNFLRKLERADIAWKSFEVYYVQNGKYERYSFLDNEIPQLRQILRGDFDTREDRVKLLQSQEEFASYSVGSIDEDGNVVKGGMKIDGKDMPDELITSVYSNQAYLIEDAELVFNPAFEGSYQLYFYNSENFFIGKTADLKEDYDFDKVKDSVLSNTTPKTYRIVLKLDKGFKISEKSKSKDAAIENETPLTEFRILDARQKQFMQAVKKMERKYSVFNLYCTENISLPFALNDYPYGAPDKKLSLPEFVESFNRRAVMLNKIKHHYYSTPYGVGAARSAFDTFSLSLYLIRTYEREDVLDDEDVEIPHLNARVLQDVLELSWSKIAVARGEALTNQSKYYSLNLSERKKVEEEEKPVEPEKAIELERINLPKDVGAHMKADTLNASIKKYGNPNVISEEDKKEFDEIMRSYLKTRDNTRETDVEVEFENLKEMGGIPLTDQCPSKEEFHYEIETKEKIISKMFEQTLKAEYIEVDYQKEIEKGKKAYEKYDTARASLCRNVIGDIIFLVLSLLVVYLPYELLQLSEYSMLSINANILRICCVGVFLGLFILAILIKVIPLRRTMRKAEKELKELYLTCCAKKRYAMSALRKRYEKDLVLIENTRYEIHQINLLYEENMKKEEHIKAHREMLEKVHDKLSAMLNNLNVEPKYDPEQSVDGEFDISKSFVAKENRIYKIFCIETIESFFSKKAE